MVVLVIFSRNFVYVGWRGLWLGSRGWTAWEAIVSVRVEETGNHILPVEAPMLRLDVPVRRRRPGSREQLSS